MRGGSIKEYSKIQGIGFLNEGRAKGRRRTDFASLSGQTDLWSGNLMNFMKLVTYLNKELKGYQGLPPKLGKHYSSNGYVSNLSIPEAPEILSPKKGSLSTPRMLKNKNEPNDTKHLNKYLDNLKEEKSINILISLGLKKSTKQLNKEYDKYMTLHLSTRKLNKKSKIRG